MGTNGTVLTPEAKAHWRSKLKERTERLQRVLDTDEATPEVVSGFLIILLQAAVVYCGNELMGKVKDVILDSSDHDALWE